MPKETVLPLQETNKEVTMIMKQKKVKRLNEDAATSRNPDSTSGIYLTAFKVAQCRQVDKNRRKKEDTKKVTAKKTAKRKVHI